jgi:23S rRNA (uracil1939-C5)-methyltransferase
MAATSSSPSASTIRLRLERMTYGTDAIAHADDGKTVFVAGGVAGDVVDALVVKDEKTFAKAVVQNVVEPSPDRVAPACPYASVCGGCPWAALSHEAQLEAKRANVVDALVRIGHMDPDRANELVDPCEAPSKPWGYRNKVELAFMRQGRRAVLGMHATEQGARKTGKAPAVIKVDACPLVDARHKKLVKSVSGALGYLTGSSDVDLERVGIRASSRSKDVEIALWTSPGPFPRAQVAKVLKDATKATSVVRVLSKGPSKARKVSGVEVLSGRGHWRERIADNTMMLSAPSFFQVNTQGAERLVELVLDGLCPTESDEAMDLYCGAGTFTLPLAERAGWVSAVESYGPAVRDLRRNLDAAGLPNAEPIGGDAGREFPDVDADVIVVDPPRAGLAPDVIDKLCDQPARAIAYVSCDPATLARDLERFANRGVFVPSRITPVDLFPQTYHVENVCLLTHS